MADNGEELVPPDTPEAVRRRAEGPVRVPVDDPTLGIDVPATGRGRPRHRLVAIGDSLSQGFQSGAVFSTDLSFPAIVAYELGWMDSYRYPRYGGRGGLPLNIELLLRDLESRFGTAVSPWEIPLALFRAHDLLDEIEDYWERGPGSTPPHRSAYNHALAVYNWDLRDALARTAASCEAAVAAPGDDVLDQLVENHNERAALRVYPRWSDATRQMTLFDAAEQMGRDHDEDTDCGIETLVVLLGGNNALRTVTELRIVWSGPDFRDLEKKGTYTVWQPAHFALELDEVVQRVLAIQARNVLWCTVPHVTIPPVARGVGGKIRAGSRYFPYYTRPWVDDARFDPDQDRHVTGEQARAVDYAIDMYNDAIQRVVENARSGGYGPARRWFLVDLAGVLDRLASRRYIDDPAARPPWWTPYPLPPALAALDPPPTSRFLTGDGRGGRATGGLFSLDGVHPTTVGYGIVAQEVVTVMRSAGVEFRRPGGVVRPDPVTVDFRRLLRRDGLVRRPPQNLTTTLEILGWADETLDLVRRSLPFRI